MSQSAPTSITLGSWNIQTLTGKHRDERLKEIKTWIKDLDILALQETHLPGKSFGKSEPDLLDIPGYKRWQFDRIHSPNRKKCEQNGGGILVYFKEELATWLVNLKQQDNFHPVRYGKPVQKEHFGLQYMHFVIEKPVVFDLVVIYHPSGEASHLVTLVKYFREDLGIENIVFIGDLNVSYINHFELLAPLTDGKLWFHIIDDTCFQKMTKKTHTEGKAKCKGFEEEHKEIMEERKEIMEEHKEIMEERKEIMKERKETEKERKEIEKKCEEIEEQRKEIKGECKEIEQERTEIEEQRKEIEEERKENGKELQAIEKCIEIEEKYEEIKKERKKNEEERKEIMRERQNRKVKRKELKVKRQDRKVKRKELKAKRREREEECKESKDKCKESKVSKQEEECTPRQTDHIISDIPPHEDTDQRLHIDDACVLPVDLKLFDHFQIKCTVNFTDFSPSSLPCKKFIVQPTWDSKTTEQDLIHWVSKHMEDGTCVVVTYIKCSENVELEKLNKENWEAYCNEAKAEVVIICKIHGRPDLEKFQQSLMEICLLHQIPHVVSCCCSLIHIIENEHLNRVISKGNEHLTESFEKFAVRHPFCHVCLYSHFFCQRFPFFPSETGLRDHLVTVHKQRLFECDKCGQWFDKVQPYLCHLVEAYGNNQYFVFGCSSEAIEITEKERHMLLRHNQFLCKDDRCQGFSYKHTEQTHFCVTCPKHYRTFHASQMKLQQHLAKYHQQKHVSPGSVCPDCNKWHRKAKKHKKTVGISFKWPFICEKCDKTFELKSWLVIHEEMCGHLDLVCEMCDTAYLDRDAYHLHFMHPRW